MPILQRRARNPVREDEDRETSPSQSGPANESDGEEEDGASEGDPQDETPRDESTESQLVKKLVRYALACEYSRTPIRREGIKEKVLGPHGRAFKKVFAGAQEQLINVFGMEMVEFPTRDRAIMSLEQKRKAGKSQTQGQATSNAYMLVSTLPSKYRTPGIIAPSKAQSQEGEASYVGLYSTLIAIITLSGGELSDARLRRHLQRLVIDKNMPSLNPNNPHQATENTEVVLQRMIRHGYLIRVSENKLQGDDDSVTWHVGPRGKVEVSNEAIAGIVRTVYGGTSAELERKLQVSLKVRKPESESPVSGETVGEGDGERNSAQRE
ncbi:hypothetical protein VTK73DRAFT_8944 [Phialemonium thermophilum]|uniref:MAGE domain-containing protein n=1 Tax=Phialemonium thermophilum TaxID=223376 RepID=A0ABR3Y6D9_9PEZI